MTYKTPICRQETDKEETPSSQMTTIPVISKENFEAALRDVFAVKSDDDIEALMTTMVEDLKPEEDAETVKYQELFLEVRL